MAPKSTKPNNKKTLIKLSRSNLKCSKPKNLPHSRAKPEAKMSSVAKSLNPWVFNLQKLELELKCPLCMNLLIKPMLLPCNHIFCQHCVPKSEQCKAECAACQHHFTNKEIRPASYMENIVSIYKSLNATFSSTIAPLLSAGVQTSVDQLHNKLCETKPKEDDEHKDELVTSLDVGMGFDKKKGKHEVLEEFDMNQAPGLSPDSSNSNPGSTSRTTEKNIPTRSIKHRREVDHETSRDVKIDARESKRQKRLSYGLSETIMESHGHGIILQKHTAICNNDEEQKYNGDASVISSSELLEESNSDGSICAFCHSSKISEETGVILHYADGEAVAKAEAIYSDAISVHRKCIDWAPKVYYVGETIKNLELELLRASKLKCSECGLKGAALGCLAKSCRRSYHVPCAVKIPDCRWDCDDFLMLCPAHNSIKFPSEKRKPRKHNSGEKQLLSTPIVSEKSNFWATSNYGPQDWVFCGSALSSDEKNVLAKFADLCGATIYKSWNPSITHVIASTDSNGACSRTLKVLMAILNGKWILTMDWVKECMEARCPVNEEPYEVKQDNHGCLDGPRSGRARASNNGPKLFNGIGFYFSGDYVPGYKIDLLDLVRVGGGTIFESMEQIFVQTNPQLIPTICVVYNRDSTPSECMVKEAGTSFSQRIAEAEVVAKYVDATVISHTWILESIAACQVLPFTHNGGAAPTRQVPPLC